MTMIIDIKKYLPIIYYELYSGEYDELYLCNNKKYAVRALLIKNQIWYEVDQEPLLTRCYIFSSTDLKETLEFCNTELNCNFLYY